MLRSQVRNTGIAVPFGRLEREQLQKALDILQQLKLVFITHPKFSI